MHSLASEIKKYLETNGISQTFLSQKTGIPVNALNLLLNEKRRMLAEEFLVICSALEKKPSDFMTVTTQD